MSDVAKKYKVRRSKRAKHVRLTMSLKDGLVVVVPNRFDCRAVPKIIKQKERWIEKNHAKLEALRRLLMLKPARKLPEHISLPAIGEEWAVKYRPSNDVGISVIEKEDNSLVLAGNVGDKTLCRHALKEWLNKKAQRHLVPWLRDISRRKGLPFKKAVVRNQKGRWGSCSWDKSISINQKLLFIPKKLVNYVFVHELCHTVFLNHSQRFWNLVDAKIRNHKMLDHEVGNHAWSKYVPSWSDVR